MRCTRLRNALAGALLLALGGADAQASLQGIIGYSGKFSATCLQCHDDGTAPVVELEGPTRFAADTMAQFRFIVRSQSEPQQHFAGFNVAVSDGILSVAVEQNARVEVNELTHNARQTNDENGESSWTFEWCVPVGGDFRLFGCGNSVNGNGTRSGDASSAGEFAVRVTPPAGDVNCDGRRTAADVTAVFTSVNAGAPGVCEQPDDGGTGTADIDTTIGLLFTPACQS